MIVWMLYVTIFGPLGLRDIAVQRFESEQSCLAYLDSHSRDIYRKWPLSIGQTLVDIGCKKETR